MLDEDVKAGLAISGFPDIGCRGFEMKVAAIAFVQPGEKEAGGVLAIPRHQMFDRDCPPSTLMQAPVIQPARGDARNTATSATSSAVPKRPDGMFCATNCAM